MIVAAPVLVSVPATVTTAPGVTVRGSKRPTSIRTGRVGSVGVLVAGERRRDGRGVLDRRGGLGARAGRHRQGRDEQGDGEQRETTAARSSARPGAVGAFGGRTAAGATGSRPPHAVSASSAGARSTRARSSA